MLRKSTLITAGSILLASASVPAVAQVFAPPVANEWIYPSPCGVVNKTINTSVYAMTNIATRFSRSDVYLAGWSSANGGEFVWQLAVPGTDPGVPANIQNQGTFAYPNAQDVEVGWVRAGGTDFLLVAYYLNGAGHFLDQYALNPSLPAPVFVGTMTLSGSPSYGRIRMDCHISYGVGIVWEYPGIGIQTLVGNSGSWSGVTTLNGTLGQKNPDVAFSHANGPLNLHYVYQSMVTATITESVLSWNTLLTTPGTISPLIEDVNTVAADALFRPVIDCPDHYNVENWAYTYTSNNSDIYVRYVDYNTSTPFTTISVNSGVLGNAPTVGNYASKSPTLHYGMGSFSSFGYQAIHVGWYVTDGASSNGYAGLHMDASGTMLLSAPDYLELPNSATPSQYIFRPGIAYNRMSEPAMCPNYLYATYYDQPTGSCDFSLHHATHPWTSPQFKGGQPQTSAAQQACLAHHSGIELGTERLSASPNPFTGTISVAINVPKAGKVSLLLTDVAGRIVAQQELGVQQGSQHVSLGKLDQLSPGAYLLDISADGVSLGRQKLVKE